jgi:hypothetical protein
MVCVFKTFIWSNTKNDLLGGYGVIIEAVFGVIKLLLKAIIALIPNLSALSLPDGLMDWFTSTVQLSAYFLPLADFFLMFGIWMVVVNFSIVWKIIQRIWDALPFT